MSYRIRALATPALAAGLRLAGVPADDVTDAADTMERATELVAQPDLGILLIEQPLFEALPPVFKREIENRALPIVVPVPRASWGAGTDRAEQYILELLRRAIGYRVKLQ